MWVLHTPEGADAPLTFRMSPGSTKTVGRASIADFIVEAALVSRVHCRLEAGHETLEVIDLESTNGVFVNGERIARAHLLPGDTLRVGRVELQVGRTE